MCNIKPLGEGVIKTNAIFIPPHTSPYFSNAIHVGPYLPQYFPRSPWNLKLCNLNLQHVFFLKKIVGMGVNIRR